MNCVFCNASNELGAQFCGSCGRALPQLPPPPVAAPPQARPAQHYGTAAPTLDGVPPVAAAPASGHARHSAQVPAPPPPARRRSDATRYLCAATHLNSFFGEDVIRLILERDYAALPSSPGVDLGEVANHALRARSRHRVRDALLTLDWVVLLIGIFLREGGLILFSVVAAWAIVFVEALVATYGVIARELGPAAASAAKPYAGGGLADEVRALQAASVSGNVTVYGGYNPFVGSGIPVNAWSFVVSTTTPAEGKQVEPFTAWEIHDAVLEQVRGVDLDGLTVEERVFADGRNVRDDPRFVSEPVARPYSRVDPRVIRDLIADPEDRARTYVCIRVPGWNDQLVLSTFLRMVLSRDSLFVEVSHSVLTPVVEEYQEADHLLPTPTVRQILTIMGRSATRLFRVGPLAPRGVWRTIVGGISRERRRARDQREIDSGLRHNYGPAMSPRELAADSRYQRYFQELDKDYYLKVVEKRILSSVVDFLESKGVDVGDLVERQTTILNEGVYVSGGTVNSSSIAAGKGAKAEAGGTSFRDMAKRGA